MLWGISWGVLQRILADAPSYGSEKKSAAGAKETEIDEDNFEDVFSKLAQKYSQ